MDELERINAGTFIVGRGAPTTEKLESSLAGVKDLYALKFGEAVDELERVNDGSLIVGIGVPTMKKLESSLAEVKELYRTLAKSKSRGRSTLIPDSSK